MSGGQILNESDIFASKASISIFSTEDQTELNRQTNRTSGQKTKEGETEEETQIREYVEEYKKEVERKFLMSKANANFKLRRAARVTVVRKPGSSREQVKTEENKYERISSRKTNKENHWTKKICHVKKFEPSFEMIGDAEIISHGGVSPEKKKKSMKKDAKSPVSSSCKKEVSKDGKSTVALKKTKLKMKKEILRRLANAKLEKSEKEVSVDSVKEKGRRANLFIVEKQTQEYCSIDSAEQLDFIDLNAQKIKSDLTFLRKRYFLKKKKIRKTKKNNKSKEIEKTEKKGETTEPQINLEAWRVTKMIYLLAKLNKRHLQNQIKNPRSLLHRELIDGVLRLVGVNVDLAGVFHQAVHTESLMEKYNPQIMERSKKLVRLEKQFREKVFQTQDKNENVLSFRDSNIRSTRYKDFSPEQLMLIRSKEVLVPPDNFSADKSRPSSMKIHKTSSQNCYKSKYQKNQIKKGAKNNSSLGRKTKVMKPASFLHTNFMTMSGVNANKVMRKSKYAKKGKSLKSKNLGSRSQRSKKQSDMWEDFLVKNVKTKIKKLNILKREKGNNYSISINNNNYNNNINLINPDMISATTKITKKSSQSPKNNKNYRTFSKLEHLKKKSVRQSNSQNSKKIRSTKNNSFKTSHLPRKMLSLKSKKETSKDKMRSVHFKTKKSMKKQKIQLDLVAKHKMLNSTSRVQSSRIISKKTKKSKPTSSVLQKLSQKSNLKHLALNLPLHPKVPKILNFNKPILNMDKSKYMLAAGYLKKNNNISQIKSDRQKVHLNAESLHCKQQKKVRSQCINTSRKLKDSRTWLVSEDKISSHSKSLLRIKEKLKKKTDYYKLNNFLKKIKDRTHTKKTQKTVNSSRPKKSRFNSEIHQKAPSVNKNISKVLF
jgi:hypothetical protein